MAKFKVEKDKNKKNLLAEKLLQKIDSCKNVDSDQTVSFSAGFEFGAYREVLQDVIEWSPVVPPNEFGRIVWTSLVNSAKEGQITSDKFLRHANDLEKEYLSRKPQRYVLLSEVSVSSIDELPKLRVGEAIISFPKKLPSTFIRSRAEVFKKAKLSLHAPYPENYRWVRVAVNCKGDGAAANAALDALHLLFGVWNLSINYSFRVSHGGCRKAVNSITLGPVHTVHFPTGKLVRMVWWFDPNYCGSITPKSLNQDIEQILSFWNLAKRRLSKIPYREKLEQWIRLYNQALDEKDWSTSFIKLWQVLEVATNTLDGRHQTTINRVAFLYEDREFNHAFLDHLRIMRNELVHESADKNTMETHLYLLKNYVEVLLLFHLENAGQFQSPVDISEFLDLPASISDLDRRLNLFKKAIRFRGRHAASSKTGMDS